MEPRPTAARERLRVQQEAMGKRRKASIGLGLTGLVALFAAGIATLIFPQAIVPLLGLMTVGLALLVVAFILVRRQSSGIFRALEK